MPWFTPRKPWPPQDDASEALALAQGARNRLDNVLDRLEAAIDRLADQIMAEQLEELIRRKGESNGDAGRSAQ